MSSPVNGGPQDISQKDVCEFDEFKSKAGSFVCGTEARFYWLQFLGGDHFPPGLLQKPSE